MAVSLVRVLAKRGAEIDARLGAEGFGVLAGGVGVVVR